MPRCKACEVGLIPVAGTEHYWCPRCRWEYLTADEEKEECAPTVPGGAWILPGG